MIIGSSGAGKSTFARRLGESTGLPVVHLDRLFWNPGWAETPKDEWSEKIKVVLLEVNPKQDWNGEYKLLTRIWGKWFNEMGIDNYCFIKNDNINEVRESMEKFMQVKITGKIETASWASVTVADSAMSSHANDLSQPISGLALKKKDEPGVTAPKKKPKPLKKLLKSNNGLQESFLKDQDVCEKPQHRLLYTVP